MSLIEPFLSPGGGMKSETALGRMNTKNPKIKTVIKRRMTITRDMTIPAIAPADKPVKPVIKTSNGVHVILTG